MDESMYESYARSMAHLSLLINMTQGGENQVSFLITRQRCVFGGGSSSHPAARLATTVRQAPAV